MDFGKLSLCCWENGPKSIAFRLIHVPVDTKKAIFKRRLENNSMEKSFS
jgi:hypothetical protein